MENKMIRKPYAAISCLFITFNLHAKPFEVHATAATDLPIQRSDIMDDLAIWVNTKDPSKSLILATNKEEPYGGLYVYSLDGKLKESYQIGPINNVDIRANFSYDHTVMDIAAATYKKDKGLAFFAVHPETGKIAYLGLGDHTFEKTPYGICLQKQEDAFYAIVTFKYTGAEKWQFWAENNRIHMEKVLSYPIQSLAEGCVVDDHTGTVFIGEEDRGLDSLHRGHRVFYPIHTPSPALLPASISLLSPCQSHITHLRRSQKCQVCDMMDMPVCAGALVPHCWGGGRAGREH